MLMDRLTELQTLMAVVEAGSLAAAARRLGRSPPSISRILADLEQRVGAILIERSTRSCRPTPAGSLLADQARQLLISYEDAIGQAAGEITIPRGPIRITAPISFGRDHVAPLLTEFLDAYPDVSLDLHLADRVVHLVEEDFDLAVRIGALADSALIARAVGQLRRVLVASPDYLEMNGTPQRPADLASHEIVQHDDGGRSPLWAFSGDRSPQRGGTFNARFKVNQPEAAIAAAREGRGLVSALFHQVHADLRTGRLVCILEDYEPDPLPISLIWPQSRQSWCRIRLLVEHLFRRLRSLDVLQRAP
jgi:DNA-binding transcriptional LysR family regulator